jgi:hypothetical protein
MIIRKQTEFRYSDVTPKDVYLNRRRFLVASAAAIGALAAPHPASAAPTKLNAIKAPAQFNVTDKETPLTIIAGYNNFYEFGTGKEDPSHNAPKWHVPDPWSVRIEGAGADKPQTLDLTAIMKIAPLEERIYRHRCVEAWSIVVPWIGFSLSELIMLAVPNSKARFVAFQSFYDSKAMLSSGSAGIRFPYVEGLRIDEAMHSVGDAGGGPVWGDAAESERHALAARGAVEVRIQEHQIHQQNHPGGEGAAHHLEHLQPARVRLLFERQPRCRSSALEPGDRATAGRANEA